MYFILVLLLTVGSVQSWQYFTTLKDYLLSAAPPLTNFTHSEYTYGDCKRKDIIFYLHTHLDHMEVLGKVIIRGWIDVIRIPTCIILRGTSYEFDMMTGTAYNFQFCVPRITYCHSQRRYKYFFYEWYIPEDMSAGMNWDIYFYGPPSPTWQ